MAVCRLHFISQPKTLMEKIPSNSESENIKKAYESNLQEAVKLASDFNVLMEEKREEEYIERGQALSKLYQEREKLKDSVNQNIAKRVEMLHQGGMKKLE